MRKEYAKVRPQDRIKIRCDRSPDDLLFKVGKIYDGVWLRWVYEDGTVKPKKHFTPIDENGESFNTYTDERWFEFTIGDGPTEPPKE